MPEVVDLLPPPPEGDKKGASTDSANEEKEQGAKSQSPQRLSASLILSASSIFAKVFSIASPNATLAW